MVPAIGDLTAMRLAWMTDIHLNFLEAADRRRFLQTARDQADAFVISGDIAESPSIVGVLAEANPQSRLLVLCGHTHGSGEVQIAENLQVLTGGAEYGTPVIQRIFDIG